LENTSRRALFDASQASCVAALAMRRPRRAASSALGYQITQELGVSDAPRDMVKDMAKLREVAQFDVRNPGASLSTTAEAVGLPPSKKTTVASYKKTPAFKRIRNDEYILYMRQQIRSATAAGDLKTALAVGRELDLYIEAQKNEL
jgi:hypothetical protein